jgi:hypothetical protein
LYSYASLSSGAVLPAFITYTNDTMTFDINANTNTYVGTYTIKVTWATEYRGGYSNYGTFKIIILNNRCPEINKDFASSYSFFAHHVWSYTYT